MKNIFTLYTPTDDLLNYDEDENINLYFIDKITDLSVAAGLIDWIIDKTS